MAFLERPFTGQFNVLTVCLLLAGHGGVRFRNKIPNCLLAFDDMGNNRANTASDADKSACLDGHIPSQLNSQEPVHLTASLGRGGEIRIPVIGFCCFKRLLDGLVGRIRQPKSIDRFWLFEAVMDDFINQPLPFPVRVSGIINLINVCAVHQAIDSSNQALDIVLPLELKIPVVGKERQPVHCPGMFFSRLIIRKIRIQVNEFVQMSNGGSHDIILAFQPCIPVFSLPCELFVLPPGESRRNAASKRRLLSDNQCLCHCRPL